MAIQSINIGTIANDGTGDDLREAFVKVNNNFTELDGRSSENTTAANLGSAGEGLFAQLLNSELQFKKIVAGNGIVLASDSNSVTVTSTATGLPSLQVFADNNNITLDANGNTLTLAGGGLTTTNLSGSTITITSTTSLQTDSTPRLTADLDAQQNNIINVGNMVGNVHGLDVRRFDGVEKYIDEFDMGLAVPTSFSSMLEFLAHDLIVDYAATSSDPNFEESAEVTADFGNLPVA